MSSALLHSPNAFQYFPVFYSLKTLLFFPTEKSINVEKPSKCYSYKMGY